MKRFIDSYLLEWSKKEKFKPLILRGARQVGKTYSVRKLAERFDSFIEINFELNPEYKSIFDLNLDPTRIAKEIALLSETKIEPGKTLLFFDEIQEKPEAITALRYFYEMMPNLHVVAAGSLLDFALESVGIPVGRVEFLYMYPLSFMEFLLANNMQLAADEVVAHLISEPIGSAIHLKLLNFVGEYLAIGGMPEVVDSWIKNRDPQECFTLHNALIDSYKQDFTKYATRYQIKYLDILLEDIPRQLGRKFKFSSVPGEFRKRELSPCLDLLTTAGIVHKVYHTDAQGFPLGAQSDPNEFKLVFIDVALAQSILNLNLGEWFLDPEKQFVNKGEIVESFVGQELLAYSNPVRKKTLYFWQRMQRSSQAEIDYVTDIKNNIVPIEVKSGSGSTLKSMHMFLESHKQSLYGIRFSAQNYSVYENIKSYPLYAIYGALKKN